jgi:hypothetical protein
MKRAQTFFTSSQPGRTVENGKTLENIVLKTLESKGFTTIAYKDYIKNKDKYNNVLIKNAPYTTIYGHKGKTEFLLISRTNDLSIRIECKWQQVPGSVDEKFPYLYLNCINAIPEKQIFIILEGKGAKVGSIEWLKKACKEKLYAENDSSDKKISVMNLPEFIIWANSTFSTTKEKNKPTSSSYK